VTRIVVRWQDWAGEGLEHLVLQSAPDGVTVESMVLGSDEGERFAVRYRLVCDAVWRARRLEVSFVGENQGLVLSGDGRGRWTDAAGRPRPDVEGAIDVDLSATPFTNTLPIRRLGLPAGEPGTIRVLYVHVPHLSVSLEVQRYTCLEPGRRYRFESVDSGFTREIEVDADGLVVTYPGLFRRLL
jgi:uncharacterized protein